MAQACARGHRLHFSRVQPGERGCDVCGREIGAVYAFHCELCDYDLCVECHLPADCNLQDERVEVLAELSRVCSEQDRVAANADDEEATSDALALHDAQLQRLRLKSVLQRYREKPPQLEELALRHEEEVGELSTEVQQLRRENLSLAFASHASGSKSSEAAAESENVACMWQRRAHCSKLRRQAQIDEFRVGCLRLEMQATIKQLRGHERQLVELRKRHTEVSSLAKELEEEAATSLQDVEKERHAVQDLNLEATSLREACHLPAQLKKQSSILLQGLDRENGRLSTEKRLHCLQLSSKLHTAIASQAPALQSLSGRAKAAMEAELARYQQLEHAHAQQLHRLHLVATRGVLGQLAAS